MPPERLIMPPTQAPYDVFEIVPDSGIQFLSFKFNINAGEDLWREFSARKLTDNKSPDGTVPVEFHPGENDPDADPKIRARPTDESYTIEKKAAVEAFLNRWIPVPFLARHQGVDQGKDILEVGPSNWARLRISP